MTRKQLDYAQEVQNLAKLVRRISSAHDVAQDRIMRDADLLLVEDEGYTRERYLGVYGTIAQGSGYRVTLPKNITPHDQYHVYVTEWQDVIYRPVSAPGPSRLSPIIEVP